MALEYTNLFTQILGGTIDLKNETSESLKYVAEDVLDDMTHSVRINAREGVERELRNVPIVGDVMTAKQHFALFNKFKKNKDDK